VFVKTISNVEIRCAVVSNGDGIFDVRITTRAIGDAGPERVWQVPGKTSFATHEDATRKAKYLVVSITAVSACGKPKFLAG